MNPHEHTPFSQEDLAEGEDLDFEEQVEGWNVYKLSDGTTLKIKTVLVAVKRLKRYNPDGTPIYIIQTQNIVRAVNVPEHLKAKQNDTKRNYMR